MGNEEIRKYAPERNESRGKQKKKESRRLRTKEVYEVKVHKSRTFFTHPAGEKKKKEKKKKRKKTPQSTRSDERLTAIIQPSSGPGTQVSISRHEGYCLVALPALVVHRLLSFLVLLSWSQKRYNVQLNGFFSLIYT